MWPTTSSVALGRIATNSGVTSIFTFLIPGDDAESTPPESTGVYVFSFQSIWNPAGLISLCQAYDLTAGQYHSNPPGVPVLFQLLTLYESEHPV